LLDKKIRLDDAMEIIKEKLDSGFEVTFSPHGVSMLPFLKSGRDTVTLSPAPERLKRYDIPLYKRENGQYVLHRIVRVGDTYTCVGDNQLYLEKGIRHDQIIAVVTSCVRNGKKISPNSLKWRAYAVFWCNTRLIRRAFAAISRRLKK
jgi:hypothetical protein